MKAEKLRSMLVKLKDGERNSKLRNDNLLQDFSKVADMGANLDNKADRLKNVKVCLMDLHLFKGLGHITCMGTVFGQSQNYVSQYF